MKYCWVVGICAALTACGEDKVPGSGERKNGFTPMLVTKEDSLYHEIMEGHDVGMAKMSKLMKARKEVKRQLDSMQKLPAPKKDVVYMNRLTDLQDKLSYAEFGMDTWMREFNPDSAKASMDVRLIYLQSERDKVNLVKKNILESLSLADSVFKK